MGKFVDRTGEVSIATNGMKMQIIAYRGTYDIDIMFEDGVIVYNKRYDKFKNGTIAHPNISSFVKSKSEKIGQTFKLSNGDTAEIVDYNGNLDVTVRLEDGSTLSKISYQSLKRGYNVTTRNKDVLLKKYLGKVNVMSNGLRCMIINFKTNKNIDVQFEDGVIKKNMYVKSFKNGSIAHPLINKKGGCAKFYGFVNLKLAWKGDKEVFYVCEDKYGIKHILTLQQMLEKSGIKPVF